MSSKSNSCLRGTNKKIIFVNTKLLLEMLCSSFVWKKEMLNGFTWDRHEFHVLVNSKDICHLLQFTDKTKKRLIL